MTRNLDTGLRFLAATSLGMALLAQAPAALADCKEAAQAELASFSNASVKQAMFSTDAEPDGKPFGGKAECSDGKKCVAVFFHEGKKPTAAPAAPGADFEAEKPSWEAYIPTRTTKDCTNLFEYRFMRKVAATGPSPAPVVAPPPPPPNDKAFEASKPDLLDANKTLDEKLRALRSARARYTAPSAAGAAQGAFDDAAQETLQILGQIVVDRASSKGYALLQARLKDALKCSNKEQDFPKSCALLETLRIQDIAMAPRALAKALAQDLLQLVRGKVEAGVAASAGKQSGPNPSSDAAETRLRDGLFDLALSLVTNAGISRDLALRNAISQLTVYATDTTDGIGFDTLTTSQKAAVLGPLTFARCVANNMDNTSKGLGSCNVEAELDQLSPPPKAKPAALALAQQLVALGAADKTSVLGARLALDTVASTACMVFQNADEPKLECPAIETAIELDDATKVAFAGAFGDALLDKDAASFVVVAAKLVSLHYSDVKEQTSKRSALRLLTGLLNYAATYADTSDDSKDDSKHAERTKILESLTKDMTDRAGRGGDCIWSLAGALRAEGGVRVATQGKSTTFYGPVGLPLGIGFDVVPEASDGWGFHMQLDAVNLGNYLALDNGPKVKKPDLGDAFAPGLTLGAGYGQDLPVVVGAFFSYTPQFQVDPDNAERHGSVNFGATVGIQVPLLDMN